MAVHYGGEFLTKGMGCLEKRVDSPLKGIFSPRLDGPMMSCDRRLTRIPCVVGCIAGGAPFKHESLVLGG